MNFPYISSFLSKNELIEYFTLSQSERNLLPNIREEKNQIGFAILLKSFIYLGYVPKEKHEIPLAVVTFIANQIDINIDKFKNYGWKNRVWKRHLSIIRKRLIALNYKIS